MRFKKIMILALAFLPQLSWGDDMVETSKIKEYELVIFKRTWTGKSDNIPELAKIYYVGKLVLDNENKTLDLIPVKNIPQNYMDSVNKRINNWRTGTSTVVDFKNDKRVKIGDPNFPTGLEYELQHTTLRMIPSEIGQKYFDNGWSKSQGDELRQAIIGTGSRD